MQIVGIKNYKKKKGFNHTNNVKASSKWKNNNTCLKETLEHFIVSQIRYLTNKDPHLLYLI